MDRYDTIKNKNPAETVIKNKQLNVDRAAHNYNQQIFMPMQLGLVHVIDCVRMLPNTDYEPTFDVIIQSRNPLVRNPFSSSRYYVKTFFVRDIDCWMGAYSALASRRPSDDTVQKNYPSIQLDFSYEDGEGVTHKLDTRTPLSLADMLDIPPTYYDPTDPIYSFVPVDPDDEDVKQVGYGCKGINALPFVGVQKICRELMNPNIINDNKNWLPTNDELFRLPPVCDEVNVLSYENPKIDDEDFMALDFDKDGAVMVPQNDNDTPVVLTSLHYCMNRGDYFNTASPFADLLRGDKPVLTLNLETDETDIDVDVTSGLTLDPDSENYALIEGLKSSEDGILFGRKGSVPATWNDVTTMSIDASAKFNINDVLDKVKALTIDHFQLKALEALTVFRTRMALTDGFYNSMITAQFGYNPRADDHRPKYIGGFFGDIMYNEVTSNSVNGNDSSQKDLLGYSASKAGSANFGNVGRVHADDFGWCITVMYIQQDNVYTQGISRQLTDLSVADVPFPLMQNIAPQPILNKELYISGDEDVDNDVFAYTAPFEWMRSRRSQCYGQYRLGNDAMYKAEFDSAMIQKRIFSETPEFNNSFLTQSPKNIDMSIFAVQNECPYDVLISKRCSWVAPLCYDYDPTSLDPTKGM